MIKLGDVFRHKEREYVYLIEYNDIIFAARILSQEESQQLKNLYEKKKIRGETTRGLEDEPIFCFVMLNTEEFKERIAHLAIDTEHDVGSLVFDIIRPLDKEDVKIIINEIKNGPVSLNLKKAFEIYREI